MSLDKCYFSKLWGSPRGCRHWGTEPGGADTGAYNLGRRHWGAHYPTQYRQKLHARDNKLAIPILEEPVVHVSPSRTLKTRTRPTSIHPSITNLSIQFFVRSNSSRAQLQNCSRVLRTRLKCALISQAASAESKGGKKTCSTEDRITLTPRFFFCVQIHYFPYSPIEIDGNTAKIPGKTLLALTALAAFTTILQRKKLLEWPTKRCK